VYSCKPGEKYSDAAKHAQSGLVRFFSSFFMHCTHLATSQSADTILQEKLQGGHQAFSVPEEEVRVEDAIHLRIGLRGTENIYVIFCRVDVLMHADM
jgi:hypothetical protein